jgi:hypothetical protein
MSFNWEIYKELNPDLIRVGLKTKQQFERHYMMYGHKEKRAINIFQKYPDFNRSQYKKNYSELQSFNNIQVDLNWLRYGVKNKRTYKVIKEIKEIKEISKDTLVLLKNSYNLDNNECLRYKNIHIDILSSINLDVNLETDNLDRNNYKYVIELNVGDIITKEFVKDNISYIESNNIGILKQNKWYFIGENQLYLVNNKDTNGFINSGIIYKQGNTTESIISINTELISYFYISENELLNSNNYNYVIGNNYKLKCLVKDNSDKNIISVLTNNVKKKNAYILFIDKALFNTEYILRLQTNVVKLLQYKYDIIELRDVSKKNMAIYENIIIEGNVFNKNSTTLEINTVADLLKNIVTCKNNYVLLHDLHDWSFGLKLSISDYSKPILKWTPEKLILQNIFNKLHITKLMSIVDCPEFNFFKNFKNIQNTYTIYHFIDTPVYNTPKVMNKTIDILFYGTDNELYYFFRNRLLNIAKKSFGVKKINRVRKYDPNICESGLAKHISNSWLCISCVSNFNYAVRKYNEISESGSVLIADSNNQIDNIVGDGMIRVSNNMNDEQIKNKFKYYLDNKILLVYLGFRARRNVEKYNDNNYYFDLNNIILNKKGKTYIPKKFIVKQINNTQDYNILKNEINLDLTNDEYLLEMDIHDNNVGILLNVAYYRSVIINNKYYVYIEKGHSSIIGRINGPEIEKMIIYKFI